MSSSRAARVMGSSVRAAALCLAWVVALCCWVTPAHAVNLVPNPSFETYTAIPWSVSQIAYASPWYRPTYGSSDYFHALSTADNAAVGVPANTFGSQSARTGSAYAGAIVYEHSAPWSREYIAAPLVSPLQANEYYRVEFYVSPGDNEMWAVDQLGALVTTAPAGIVPTDGVMPGSPQATNNMGSYLSDETTWTRVAGMLLAQGGEEHIAIGNFADEASNVPTATGRGNDARAYYYIDDVSVELVEEEPGPATDSPWGLGPIIIHYDNALAGFSSAVQTSPGAALPPGYRDIANTCFDLSTTRLFVGNAHVTLPYDEAALGGASESGLRLFHWKNGAWEDVTAYVDPANNTVTGITTSFSDFVIGAPGVGGASVSTPASSSWSLALGVMCALGVALVSRKRRTKARA